MTAVVTKTPVPAEINTPSKVEAGIGSLEFTDGSLALSAGGDEEGRAEEQMEVSFDGEPITTAFNPQFLLDGLNALGTGRARMLFTSPNKPAVLRPEGSAAGAYTYVTMPVRMPG